MLGMEDFCRDSRTRISLKQAVILGVGTERVCVHDNLTGKETGYAITAANPQPYGPDIGWVCGGWSLSRHQLVVGAGAFIVLGCSPRAGILIYVALWFILPLSVDRY